MMDLLGERIPHYDAIAKIATLADKGKIKMVVSAFSYPTVYDLLTKFESAITRHVWGRISSEPQKINNLRLSGNTTSKQ